MSGRGEKRQSVFVIDSENSEVTTWLEGSMDGKFSASAPVGITSVLLLSNLLENIGNSSVGLVGSGTQIASSVCALLVHVTFVAGQATRLGKHMFPRVFR